MTALLEMEDFVSKCVKVFETRMREFATSGQSLDMAHWLQCYAFDVIGEITVRDYWHHRTLIMIDGLAHHAV